MNTEAITWAVRAKLRIERGRGRQVFQAKCLLIELAGHAGPRGYGCVNVEEFRSRLTRTGGKLYSPDWLFRWLSRLERAGHVCFEASGDDLHFQLVGYPV